LPNLDCEAIIYLIFRIKYILNYSATCEVHSVFALRFHASGMQWVTPSCRFV